MTRTLLAALTLGLMLTACGTADPAPETAVTPAAPAPTETAPATSAPAPTVRPRDVRASSTCNDDWPVVMIPNAEGEGQHRFVAEVTVHNDGTARAEVAVRTTWHTIGIPDVIHFRLVFVPPGGSKRVKHNVPVTTGQLGAMAGHQPGDQMCTTEINLVR